MLQRGRRIDQAQSRRLGREFATGAIYLELGRIYERLGQPRQAIEALEYGRRLAQCAEVCEELASLYRDNGELEWAAVTYIEALSLNPDRTAVAGKLAEVYRSLDPRGCSLTNGALNVDCPLVRQHVCTSARNVARLYRKTGKGQVADSVQSQAIRNFGCPADGFESRKFIPQPAAPLICGHRATARRRPACGSCRLWLARR